MQTLYNHENPRVKINREVVSKAFNKSNMRGNIKGKREYRLRQSWEKIMIWKYSVQPLYFGHIFILSYQIDPILVTTEGKLEYLQLFSLPKIHNWHFEG